MEISAVVTNSPTGNQAVVRTGAATQSLSVAAKTSGPGSAVNGGEFLMLALATCYCNDLYREADRLGIAISGVEVEASAEFPGIGLAATNVRYRARVSSSASAHDVATLLRVTDAVSEVHNTLRAGVAVQLITTPSDTAPKAERAEAHAAGRSDVHAAPRGDAPM
jgi:organic hydroperoxide reductase OsmC/OhrA